MLVSWLLILLFGIGSSISKELYVGSSSTPCPSPSVPGNCTDDLGGYLDDFVHNMTIIFLEGTHSLPNRTIVFKELYNIRLEGLKAAEATVLQCTSENGGILFVQCSSIHVSNITLFNCSTDISAINSPAPALLQPFVNRFGMGINATTDVNLVGVTIQNCSHTGLLIVDSLNVTLMDSNLIGNGLGRNESNIVTIFTDSFISVGGVIAANDSDLLLTNHYVDIFNTNVKSGGQYGLEIILRQTKFMIDFRIVSSNFMFNLDMNIIQQSQSSCHYTLMLDHVVSSHSIQGGGFALIQDEECMKSTKLPVIDIRNSFFTRNRFLGMHITWLSVNQGRLNMSSCVFDKNIGIVASALFIQLTVIPVYMQGGSSLDIHFTDLTFSNNDLNSTLTADYGISKGYAFTVVLFNVNDVIFENCTFVNNIGTGMIIYNSYVIFTGVNNFTYNRGVYGGALLLAHNAYMILNNESRMIFVNNHATKTGGAIQIRDLLIRVFDSSENSGLVGYCFYQVPSLTPIPELFYFRNNTAGIAGDVIYGYITDRCVLFGDSFDAYNIQASQFIMNSSTFINQTGNSLISSDPRRVCFCTSNDSRDFLCHLKSMSYNARPGSKINISLIITGNGGGYTPGTVALSSNSETNGSAITEYLQACRNVSYRVTSTNKAKMNETVYITISGRNSYIKYNTLIVDVSLDDCDEGFELSDTGVCQCLPGIERQSGVTCLNDIQEIRRSGEIWIGYVGDGINCTVVNRRCPFDYCVFHSTDIRPSEPDINQCTAGRVGQLCGKCPENSSLTLGLNTCKDCRGKVTLLIVVVFALAGIGLVFLLFLLNLTVSVGTINSLIFFANVVKIVEPLLPIEPIPFLALFISWLNLDFGVTMCFFDGMDACYKVGFQFIFPVYLWLIIAVIVIVCKYSSKVANLLGNQSVPVLATLLLLSYTKILRTVILIFSASHIECLQGHERATFWFVDPTIRYCTGCHLILFIVGVIVMIFIIVPFTFFLLLYPVFESMNPRFRAKCSWLLFKLKPFFDAYRGPHMNLFYFYPGMLLIARIIVAMGVGLSFRSNTSLDVLLAVLVVQVTLLSTGKVYKPGTWYHIIDILFILSLIVLAYAVDRTFSEKFASNASAKYGTILVLSMSFIMFLGIIFYHVFQYTRVGKRFVQLNSSYLAQKWNKTKRNTDLNPDDIDKTNNPQPETNRAVAPSIHTNPRESFNELRESLLDYIEQ